MTAANPGSIHQGLVQSQIHFLRLHHATAVATVEVPWLSRLRPLIHTERNHSRNVLPCHSQTLRIRIRLSHTVQAVQLISSTAAADFHSKPQGELQSEIGPPLSERGGLSACELFNYVIIMQFGLQESCKC